MQTVSSTGNDTVLIQVSQATAEALTSVLSIVTDNTDGGLQTLYRALVDYGIEGDNQVEVEANPSYEEGDDYDHPYNVVVE